MQKIFSHTLSMLLLLISLNAIAQTDIGFTHANELYYNPAFAGVDGVTRVMAIHRSQWLGYQSTFDDGGAPVTQFISLNTPIFKLNSGFGFHVVNDNLGAQNNLEVQGSFAYHLGLKNSKMSFGIKMGIFSQSLNYDRYRAIDPSDVALRGKNGRESQIRPDLALGVFYRAEKYFAGVSFNHLLRSEFDFGVEAIRNALENHLNVMFGYVYKMNDMVITPSFIVQTDFNEYTFLLSGLATYKEKAWGGLAFRQSEDFNAMMGYNFLKSRSLGIGYSFGYIVKNRNAKQTTSHEVMLRYDLPVSVGINKKSQRTPRFRY